MKVTYNLLVQQDINEICDYYDTKGDGLSEAFFAEFESVIAGIIKDPGRWSPIEPGTDKRKAQFDKFPYVLIYRKVTSQHIRVFVVKHKKRRELLGMRRK